jgi:hypothetical protein
MALTQRRKYGETRLTIETLGMNRNSRIVLIIVGGLLALAAGFILLIMNLLQLPMYVNRTIAEDVKVNSEWIELTPSSSMKIKRQYQAIGLVIDGARTPSKSSGLFLKDGTPINPEVQISDTAGNWYELKGGSYGVSTYDSGTETWDADIADFKPNDWKLPADIEFKTLRIRSDHPFTCKKVIWTNYNLK